MENNKKIVVVVSGGFDPVHVGHVRMFNEAKKLGDELIVVLNNDNWLKRKKGYSFMPQEERKEVIESFGSVDRVVYTTHTLEGEDMTVCESLRQLQPDIFANGGDRKDDTTPEVALCNELGIDMAFNVGAGGKMQSSSWLIEKAKEY